MSEQKGWRRTPAVDGERIDIDWRQFERLIDELLPILAPGSGRDSISKIGRFVRGIMDRAKPDAETVHDARGAGSRIDRSELFHTDVTETEKLVKVRIRIPEHVDPRKMQLFVNGQTLKIEGPLGNRQTVGLPAPVGVKSGQAVFRNQSLHIRLRKRSSLPYKELFIRYP